jgi:hypothetical protein
VPPREQPFLSAWTKRAESLETRKNLLYFKQFVGLKIDEKRLAALEQETKTQALKFLREADGEPRPLFFLSVSSVGTASTYKQFLQLHKARTSKIVSRRFKLNGKPVNWGSWRQFAAGSDDSAARKELFDDFVSKSSILGPLIKKRFETYRAVLHSHDTDPLSAYLEHERIGYDRLISMVKSLGEGVREAFREALAGYSEEILGRPAEYFDDYYFFRNRIFRKYAERPPTAASPVPKVLGTLKRMGLDATKVKVDQKDRPGKSASAFCAPIRVPTDVRISYRKANPLEDFASVFHEFGHGIHFASIDKEASFSDRYWIANGVSETFSIFFEGLIHDERYLAEELGFPVALADDTVKRFRFNVLFFAAFYAANSTLKLRYWHDQIPFEELDGLYSDLTEGFMGIRYPGAYWKLHHVMPEYFLYSPSYLVAAVRALELRNALVAKFGERYWNERGSGKVVHELMRRGQSLDLSFSKLDEGAYVESLSGG